MAIQFTCDLCGGKLVMKGAGKAVCEDCGMEYDAEYLKEKLGKGGSTSKTESQEKTTASKNKEKEVAELWDLLEMELSLDGPNIITYASRILKLAPNDLRANIITTTSAAHNYNSDNHDLDELKEFYAKFTDEDSRNQLHKAIIANNELFYNLDVHYTYKHMATVDVKLGESYIEKEYSSAAKEYAKKFEKIRNDFKEYSSKAPLPAIVITQNQLMFGEFEDQHKHLKRELETTKGWLEKLQNEPSGLLLPNVEMYLTEWRKMIEEALNLQGWDYDRNSRRVYRKPYFYDHQVEELNAQIGTINYCLSLISKLKKTASLRYWNDRPEERDALLEKQDELQKEANDLKAKLAKVWDGFLENPLVEKYRDAAREIEHLKYQIEHTLGFFKKSGLKSQLSEREAELYSLKFEYEQLEAEYQKKYDDMDNKLAEIEDQLIDIECTLENVDDE